LTSPRPQGLWPIREDTVRSIIASTGARVDHTRLTLLLGWYLGPGRPLAGCTAFVALPVAPLTALQSFTSCTFTGATLAFGTDSHVRRLQSAATTEARIRAECLNRQLESNYRVSDKVV
jgi:hypothetical protein